MTSTAPGDNVTHLGRPATVMHGYNPEDPWLPAPAQRRPATVNIRYDRAVPGHSRQFDVLLSALLPAS